MDLSGTTALITGAAHRVGRGIAVALAAAGCDVVLHYHSSAGAAEETADEIRALGRRVTLAGADLSDPAGPPALFEAAGGAGPVRVLVNSAAVFPEDTLADVTPDGLRRTLETNLAAPVFLTQAFAGALPKDAAGAVVNVTDWRTARPYPDHFSYTVAKGALDTFTVAAAEALAPRIRVNAVALGAILPPPGKPSSYLKTLAKEIPLRRVGDPGLVGDAVVSLVRNDFITGETLRLDGGAHLR
ncbi:MAG: SDR family oxidoreductase [Actinobacteria bacterium]|nr:SDR family oxidoreductase [Actinomycetota bacterium]